LFQAAARREAGDGAMVVGAARGGAEEGRCMGVRVVRGQRGGVRARNPNQVGCWLCGGGEAARSGGRL
jgi:hypothetical protein